MFAMGGASRMHNLITTNLVREISQMLLDRPCEVYPSDLRIHVPATGLYTYPDVAVVCTEPQFEDQELDTRGTTMIIYWEGACDVEGEAGEAQVKGRAYVEMVGYDRSHDQPNLAYFLMGNQFEFPPKSFF